MTSTKNTGAVKITTPYLTQGGRGNWSFDVDHDMGTLTVTNPMANLTVELALAGEHLEQFAQVIAAEVRKARKARLTAVTA